MKKALVIVSFGTTYERAEHRRGGARTGAGCGGL